jgi:hypothetical protein
VDFEINKQALENVSNSDLLKNYFNSCQKKIKEAVQQGSNGSMKLPSF